MILAEQENRPFYGVQCCVHGSRATLVEGQVLFAMRSFVWESDDILLRAVPQCSSLMTAGIDTQVLALPTGAELIG